MRTSRFVTRSFGQAVPGVALLFAPVSGRRGSRLLGRCTRGVMTLAAIAGVGLSVASVASAASITVGTQPFGAAVTPNGADVYVANAGAGTVSEIRTSDNTVINTITVGTNPSGVAVTPNGADIYVTNYGSGSVSEINTTTNAVVGSAITVANRPGGIAVTPNGADIYVANYGSGSVSEINTTSNAVVDTINVGTSPESVAVAPDGADVYVTNASGSGTVSEIRTSDNTVVNTITVGAYPYGVAVTPSGADIYVTNTGAGTVSEIRTSDDVVVNTVTVGSGLYGIAVTPSGAELYVTNYNSGTVTALALLADTTPAGAASFGSAFSGRLAVNGASGTVTYNTTVTSPQVSVSAAGAITAAASTPLGVYTVSGTDSDTAGDFGTWTFTLTVNQASTTTSLSSSQNPSLVGGQVTYTVTVTPTPDGGTVSFNDGQTPIAGCDAQPINGGAATCSVSYAAAGSSAITAVYSGAGNYLGSSSDAVTQTVTATATATPTPTPTSTTPIPTLPTRPSVLAVARQTRKVTTRGVLKIKVTCRNSACTGTLKLTARVTNTSARVTRATGKGKHKPKKTTTIVTIATVSLSALTVHAHIVSIKLNKAGLRLLKAKHYKLRARATTTYRSGSSTKTTHAKVMLKGTRPKRKHKKAIKK